MKYILKIYEKIQGHATNLVSKVHLCEKMHPSGAFFRKENFKGVVPSDVQ